MPRRKPDSERGYIGAWMVRERDARGWTDAQVVDALRLRGQVIREDYLRQLHAGSGGKRPGPELLDALIDLYGSTPQPFPKPPTSPDSDALIRDVVKPVLDAIDSQTQVLEKVWRSLDNLADSIRGGQDTVSVKVLGDVLGKLAARGMLVQPPEERDEPDPTPSAPAPARHRRDGQ